MSMKNPIYVEYYSHDDCLCYKLDNPWTRYRKHTVVLGTVKDNYKEIISRAKEQILKWADEAFLETI